MDVPTEGMKDPAGESRRNVLRMTELFRNVRFRCQSYQKWTLSAGDVVYCDPPYARADGGLEVIAARYGANLVGFDSGAFWAWAEQQARDGVRVVVSEITAPPLPHWIRAHGDHRSLGRGRSGKAGLERRTADDALWIREDYSDLAGADIGGDDTETFAQFDEDA